MAREDREGSGIYVEFMTTSPVFFGEYFLGCKNSEKERSRSLNTAFHMRVNGDWPLLIQRTSG
jgi:hypothetical protein